MEEQQKGNQETQEQPQQTPPQEPKKGYDKKTWGLVVLVAAVVVLLTTLLTGSNGGETLAPDDNKASGTLNDPSIPGLFTYPDDAKINRDLLNYPLEIDGRKVLVNVDFLTADNVEVINFNFFDGVNYIVRKERLVYCENDPAIAATCSEGGYTWYGKDSSSRDVLLGGNNKLNVIIGHFSVWPHAYRLGGFPEGHVDNDKYFLLLKLDPSKFPPD